MRIVADENIPCVREAFGAWGQVEAMPGFAITPEKVRDADLLLVRSVTRVDEALLSGSRVRCVATATAGVDHLDTDYLAQAGIPYCDAPGSNADAVAQYVIVALHALAPRLSKPLSEHSIAIIGAGNIGSRLARLCETLNMRVILNDPPLAEKMRDPRYRPLAEAMDCDILSLHVPLIKHGPHKTLNLVDSSFLNEMKPGSILINASRGAVIDESALKIALDRGKLAATVLDVWQNEPKIDSNLLQKVTLGTPHIAGYSIEAKLRGTSMIRDRLAARLGLNDTWDLRKHLDHQSSIIELASEADLPALFTRVYDIRRDDRALRQTIATSDGSGFHQLRKNYPPRREFSAYSVVSTDGSLLKLLAALGFRTATSNSVPDPL